MPKVKKTPKIQYGIEITKPHSKEMYDHNDTVALEMKRNILSEIHIAYSQAIGNIAAEGGMSAGAKRLRDIQVEFMGVRMGVGYSPDEVKDDIIKDVTNSENWALHQNYGYLHLAGIVPKVSAKMIGFDNVRDNTKDPYWVEEGPIEKVQYDDGLNENFDGREEYYK